MTKLQQVSFERITNLTFLYINSTVTEVVTTFPIKLEGEKALSITLESYKSSTRELVGLQLWRGAFLLAEYLCHNQDLVKNKTVLELASGTGFTSLVASLSAQKVICTDIDEGSILQLIRDNFQRNSLHVQSSILVAELDFLKSDWKLRLQDELDTVDLILAADVVYNADITRAFFKTLSFLLSQPKEILVIIALEKRLWMNDDGDIVAPSYSLFLDSLEELKQIHRDVLVEQIMIDFPHSLDQFYDRVDTLVVWQIQKT